MKKEVEAAPSGLRAETAIDLFLERHLGNALIRVLSLLTLFILIAAILATYDVVVHDLPKLW